MVTGNNTLFETIPEEMVIEIEIERLRDFYGHPFKVRDDERDEESEGKYREIWNTDSFDRQTSTGRPI